MQLRKKEVGGGTKGSHTLLKEEVENPRRFSLPSTRRGNQASFILDDGLNGITVYDIAD